MGIHTRGCAFTDLSYNDRKTIYTRIILLDHYAAKRTLNKNILNIFVKEFMWEADENAVLISENDNSRSDYIRELFQKENSLPAPRTLKNELPRSIVQFWHNREIPDDVLHCMNSWMNLKHDGYTHEIFDNDTARELIEEQLGSEATKAFDYCYHPAMKSDYFRLCYLYSKGGLYVDADDDYNGINIDHLFKDRKLKLQPLCYDLDSDQMVPPQRFVSNREHSDRWIYYFNNNPIASSSKDPIIEYALNRSTKIILSDDKDSLPEIQSTAGPGNITASVVAYFASHKNVDRNKHLTVLSNWGKIAETVWDLSYRNDARNWRLSNQKNYYMEAS